MTYIPFDADGVVLTVDDIVSVPARMIERARIAAIDSATGSVKILSTENRGMRIEGWIDSDECRLIDDAEVQGLEPDDADAAF